MKKFKLFSVFIFLLLLLTSCVNKDGVSLYKFYNYDGSLIWTQVSSNQNTLEYLGPTPTRDNDEKYNYTFSSWDKELNPSQKIYYAKYDRNLLTFNVKFYNFDGSYIKTCAVTYGGNALDVVNYIPKRPGSERKQYIFEKWTSSDADLTYVTKDCDCIATFKEITLYKVIYLDNDGTILHTEYVPEGENGKYVLEQYTMIDTNTFKTFVSWSKSVINVREDITTIATYENKKACTVTFYNYNDSYLGKSVVPEGFDAVYTGKTPTRPKETSGNYIYTYTFSGWDRDITNVTQSFSTYAKYNTSSTYHNPAYKTALSVIRSNATTYDSETGRYYKGFGAYISSSYSVVGYGEYDSSTHVVDLYFAETYSNYGASVTIFFDNEKPGTYYCSYKYASGSYSAMGTFSISSYWSSSSTISYFSNFTNLSLQTESYHETIASELISACLSSAKNTSWIYTNDLGFNNY